ncbi:MAG TPA: glycosyltransferase family 4 protein [Acidimicrobiales bacterium]|nr:glycosyltransferase family 4 protein [Acidimicrobiales bacterium]
MKRTLLRVLLGRRVTIWTIGEQNSAYWSNLGYDTQVRIPYTVPDPPRASFADGLALRRSALQVSDSDFFVLFVGRLEEWKGVIDLCSAFRELSGCGVKVVLGIVGNGSLRRAVEEQARSDVRIRVLGAKPHSEVGQFYAAADLLVVPSHEEPWGLVVNEALVNGCRVLASDAVGAADDLITDRNGARFPAGDRVALRKALAAEITSGRRRAPTLVEVDVVTLFEIEMRRILSASRL